ncbi:hypothetical protein [Erwinia sp. 9145]|nr:hypothetical protein [Erwinia sp. 9145]
MSHITCTLTCEGQRLWGLCAVSASLESSPQKPITRNSGEKSHA